LERAFDVLGLLSEVTFCSGESLANYLGITRAAVWRHVNRLKEAGVDIESIPGKGYRLKGEFDALRPSEIRECLSSKGIDSYHSVEVVRVIDSTNAALLRRSDKKMAALFAEYQSAGKGRREDKWVSPPGAGLCFSVSRWFDQPQASFSALGLVVGVSVVDTLKCLGVKGLKLKWPNDIVFGGSKLAGILIELQSEVSGPCFVVIGIGLNIHLSLNARGKIEKSVVDLREITGKQVSRNLLASTLLANLQNDLEVFGRLGFKPFLSAWSDLDSLVGRKIQINIGSKAVIGEAAGVDDIGALRLKVNGEFRQFLSGHIVELL